MEFHTMFEEKRPIRLSEATRAFAYESLYERKYGLDAMSHPWLSADAIPGFAELSDTDKYDAMIALIAAEAPVRICDGEKISGAATLGGAVHHYIPVLFEGKQVLRSISHLTIDYAKVMRIGMDGLEAEVQASLRKHTDPRRVRFLKSCLSCLRAFRVWHGRYIDALSEKEGYGQNLENLRRVPLQPPRNFYEAVQCIWMIFAFVRLCGNWPGIGRLDVLLGEYLKKDLAEGVLTLDGAREILAHFFIKGCEWVTGLNRGSGDAQHYQNIVLAGIGEDGEEVTNEVTYLVLDIVEELSISDFPITVRINSRTDPALIRRTAEVMRFGGGVIAVYNEDLILKALTDFGYPLSDARQFANDGCWEVQIPGKTDFGYIPFDGLALLQKETLRSYAEDVTFADFEALYGQYVQDLTAQVQRIFDGCTSMVEKRDGAWYWKPNIPCTVVSLFEEDCIGRGQSYFEGGPVYTVRSPHIGGLADIVNSLYAIKKLVFDERKISFTGLMTALRQNWEGYEELRQYVLSRYEYYGCDNDEVDMLAARLLNDFADACLSHDGEKPVRFNAGVSTFGRQIEWAPHRMASPHGRKSGEVLAANATPTPGTGTKGATAIIKSYCKADLSKQTTGTALDIRLLPADVRGSRGIEAISALIRGFAALGGYFMQIDVADASVLRDAQAHPENYPALAVRISGWNARFVTLNREWQDMVIGNIEGQ